MADIVAWDLPAAKQASNDSGLGSRSDALGEVKTMQPGKSSYQKGNCQENRPVDQRATKVRWDYKKRACGLDRTHAPEVVGDGTNGQVGPFEAALGTFYTGNVLPIVVGAIPRRAPSFFWRPEMIRVRLLATCPFVEATRRETTQIRPRSDVTANHGAGPRKLR